MSGFRDKNAVRSLSPQVGAPLAVETNDLYLSLLRINHDSLPHVDDEQSNGSDGVK